MSEDLKELAESVKSSSELFDCKFVEPFPKEVQTDCSVCLHTLKQPYVVGCCGYRFCKSCLAPSIKSCPLCKEVNFDRLQDKQLERLLNQRLVYCLLQGSGCKWTGELGKLSSHLSFEDSLSVTACEKLPVPCSHCGGYFKRADLPGHQGVCESRPSQCIYCSYKCPFKKLASHHKSCLMIPQKCKNNCSEKLFTKEELKSHRAKDCPLQYVFCEYLYAGCESPLMRKDMKDHVECEMKHHLSLVTTKCTQLQDKETSTSSELQKLQTQVATLTKKMSELASRYQEVSAENEQLKRQTNQSRPTYIKVSNLPEGAIENDINNIFRRFGTPDVIIRSRLDCVYIHYRVYSNYGIIMQAHATKPLKLMKQQLVLELSYYP